MKLWMLACAATAVVADTPLACDYCGCGFYGCDGSYGYKMEDRRPGPIVTVSPSPMPQGRWAADFRADYTRFMQYSDTEMIQAAERGVNLENTKTLTVYTAALAYGATKDLTVAISQPWIRRGAEQSGSFDPDAGHGTASNNGDSKGFGGLTLSAKWRVARTAGDWALLGGVKLPTGDKRETARDGSLTDLHHQPDSGSTNAFWGLAWSHPAGPVGLYADVVCQHRTAGTQGETLGDVYQLNLAATRRLGKTEKVSWDGVLELNGRKANRDKSPDPDGLERNTGGVFLDLTPGIRVNLDGGWAMYAATPIPVLEQPNGEQAHVSWGVIAGISRTF